MVPPLGAAHRDRLRCLVGGLQTSFASEARFRLRVGGYSYVITVARLGSSTLPLLSQAFCSCCGVQVVLHKLISCHPEQNKPVPKVRIRSLDANPEFHSLRNSLPPMCPSLRPPPLLRDLCVLRLSSSTPRAGAQVRVRPFGR